MKIRLVFLLVGCLPFCLGAGGSDVLVLRSGAELQGRLLHLRVSGVRFEPRWSENATTIPMRDVEAVFLGAGEAEPGERPGHRIYFLDGDRLTGRVLERKEETIMFRLAEGLVLEVRKDKIERLESLPSADEILLEDSMDLSLWQAHAARVMQVVQAGQRRPAGFVPGFAAGVAGRGFPLEEQGGSWLFSPGNIAGLSRALPDLPERFVLEYAMRPFGAPFLVAVVAFSSQPMQQGGGGIRLMHQNIHVQGQMFQEAGVPESVVSWRESHEVPEREWQHFQVFVDRIRKRAWMVLNGQALREWEMVFEDSEEMLSGRWLSFHVQQNSAGVQMTGIQVTRWNGEFPLRTVERFGDREGAGMIRGRRSNEAEVRLRSHADRLTLRVREITATEVVAGGEAFVGELLLPRDGVAGLRFPWMRSGRGDVPGLSIDLDTPILLRDLQEGGRQ